MITAIDTNILLDILIPNAEHLHSSLRCLTTEPGNDELIVCEMVYAELSSQFLSAENLDTFIRDTGIRMVSSNKASLFRASLAWKTYLGRRKRGFGCPACGRHNQVICGFCGKTITSRQHIIADFLIGAHAEVQADRFITRDRGFYRAYFQGLNILYPQ